MYKWTDKASLPDIDLVFEFVSSLKYCSTFVPYRRGSKIADVCNGWCRLKLDEIPSAGGEQSLPVSGGTPISPAEEAKKPDAVTKEPVAGDREELGSEREKGADL